MSTSDRMPYLTATTLDQALLDECHDNLTCQLELAVDLSVSGQTIHVSDRNKYVGSTFYQARTKFPVITRTLGDWLSGSLEFSTIDLTVSNVDGIYNDVLPAGSDYDGWIGASIEVSLGLRDVAATYTTIFKGYVTPVGGFGRNPQSLTLTGRDNHETATILFPTVVFLKSDWPKISDDIAGKGIPIIYGDWTQNTSTGGPSVPAYPVNGADPSVNGKKSQVLISLATPAVFTLLNHNFDVDSPVMLETDGTLPSPFVPGSTYYVRNPTQSAFELSNTPGGASLSTAGSTQTGTHQISADTTIARPNVKFVIAENPLTYFDQTGVYLRRSSNYYLVPSSEVVNVLGTNNYFEVKQSFTGPTWIDGGAFQYTEGDEFFVLVKGKDISSGAGTYDSNAVWIAKDILKTYGGMTDADFDANWTTYRDKNDPTYPQSAIANIVARAWIQESTTAMEQATSLLEQVRLELFVDRNLKFKINSLHFEDWDATPSFQVKNWDLERNTLKPSIDVKNNWNRARGVYNYLPDTGQNTYQTPVFRNNAAISQVGRELSKTIEFPNLCVLSDVENQVKEMLKLAGAYLEVVEMTLTWRAALLDIGQFVYLDVQIGSTVYQNVPAMIRQIGYDPNGLKIPVKVWSMQIVPFPGWSPGFAGITGGSTATITQE